MTQQEINVEVAKTLGHIPEVTDNRVYIGIKHEGDNITPVMGVVDYCNRAQDSWKIISMLVSGGCKIVFDRNQVRLITPSEVDYRVNTENHLEGLMIAYLKSIEDSRERSSQKIDAP